MKLFDLSGKVAIVTGSSRGIGRAIAELFAEAGAKVTISARNQGPCDEVVDAIRQKGGEAIAVTARISDQAQLENLVAKTRAEWGRIDILVCNAAIIFTISIGALKASTVIGMYGVTKAADFALCRSLAAEWGPDSVRVNCIAPGLVVTDFARALYEDPERRARVEAETPLRRLGQPVDIAGAALLLASPAGAFITGTTIVVDGGRMAV